jgi:hypothetical protein
VTPRSLENKSKQTNTPKNNAMNKKLILLALGGITLTGLAHAGPNVTILYAYTNPVVSYYGNSENVIAHINSNFDRLKTLHTNSKTNVAFPKAIYKTNYSNTSKTSQQQWEALAGSSGSDLQDVRNMRDRVRADLVQLFVDFGGGDTVLGRGAQPGWASVVRKEVLGATSLPNQSTSSHEVGHNFNASHGQGFCLTSRQRTVMEPNDGSCTNYTRIYYFSSSVYRLNNVALGDSNNNNTQSVINQAPITAGYK